MYGTVAQMRAKSGTQSQLIEHMRNFAAARVPGAVAVYCYLTDPTTNEYYVAVVFSNKETYVANAESPEQDVRYRQLLTLLESEPSWHDGEIICAIPEQQ